MVPHLETTAASLSGGGAGPAFVVGLLVVDVKRGSNIGNGKKSHCSCHGGGTSLAFFVGLLDIDSKRGGQKGQQGNITRLQQGLIVVVAVAGWQWRWRRPGLLSACLASRSRT